MKLKPLPQNYTHLEAEKRWQRHWVSAKTYAWNNDSPRDKTYVIDTPPPTVSGLLHMGHVFSYTQCDFVARYQRMKGMDVFYPMGFDDNGLPTERLVEKAKKIRAIDMSREDFIAECMSVSEEARGEFRELFQSIALSVDWAQEYHTISESSRRISQESFLDLYEKGHVERQLKPFFWDPVDQTAIAQAEIEDKELPSHQNIIPFGIVDAGTKAEDIKWGQIEKIKVMTTRPELLGACVALMCHPDDASRFKGKQAVSPLFGVVLDIKADEKVNKEKGTGFVMCCTFGDETDIEWWRTHNLPTRVILNKYGKLELLHKDWLKPDPDRAFCSLVDEKWKVLDGLKVKAAREKTIEILQEMGLLLEQTAITHAVKCAERSSAPLEILPTHQWFVKVCDKKEALKARANECSWNPDWMKLRMEQWIDGLNSDWCISRQRYFGVPFPVWYLQRINLTALDNQKYGFNVISEQQDIVCASLDQLPVNPLSDLPSGFERIREMGELFTTSKIVDSPPNSFFARRISDGAEFIVSPDFDVMDTWATSSISPQISAGGIYGHPAGRKAPAQDLLQQKDSAQSLRDSQNDDNRFNKLFPADLRPQAHEIIRTWAFYTVVKSHLHSDTIPWKNLMISGWCLAEDKTKMSKSKGNVVTPVELIEEQGTDAVRYWAATSRLGADTAFSKDLLKIGKKLVNKLWNATKFAAIHLEKLDGTPPAAAHDTAITAPLDKWILTRLRLAIKRSTDAFESYEYADGLRAVEDFFWNDFCDNYLELVKTRVYGQHMSSCGSQSESAGSQSDSAPDANASSQNDNYGQQSAVHTIYHALQGILKLFAPFVPHITEELYSHIFADDYARTGSLHARGQWPLAAEYPCDTNAEAQGIAAVSILNTIRKAKSERGVSIKYPIDLIMLYAEPNAPAKLDNILDDVKAAGNVAELIWSDELPEASTHTDCGCFALALRFAAQADVA